MYRVILTERFPPCYDDCADTQDDQDCQVCPAHRECDAHECDDCDYAKTCTQYAFLHRNDHPEPADYAANCDLPRSHCPFCAEVQECMEKLQHPNNFI